MFKHWLVMSSMFMACGGFACIARGANVKTPRGSRRIEELVVGDEVVVVDPQTLEAHVAKITAVKSAKRECSLLNELRLTSAHPLFDTEKNEWAPAGDWLLGSRTHFATLHGPQRVTHAERFVGIDDVFDLMVDHPLHTFVADGVVVHNKSPPPQSCVTTTGAVVFESQACACPLGAGIVQCNEDVAVCGCNAPGYRSTLSFNSKWQDAGEDDAALLDGVWSRLMCGPTPRSLVVVKDWSLGWFEDRGALLLRERGDCHLETDLVFAENESSWGQLWFLERSQSTIAPSIVRIDDTVLFGVRENRVWFEPTLDSNGAPAPKWFSPNVAGSWQRYEWQLEVLSGNTYRFWPRFRLADGNVKSAETFFGPDGGTLADWYDGGHAFSFSSDSDGGTRVISLGHQTPANNGSTVMHVADFALSNDGWIGW